MVVVEGKSYISLNRMASLKSTGSKDFSLLPFIFRLPENREFTSKLLAPRLERLESISLLMPSTAVSIPTSEVIPMAIIRPVKMVLRIFALIELIPSEMFCAKFIISFE
jgi:hypothetical protein